MNISVLIKRRNSCWRQLGGMMTLLNLILLIILAGVLLWAVNRFVPMPGLIKNLLNVLVFIILLLYVLQFFGLIKPILPFPPILK